jgi:hypothetical protein
MTKKTGAYVLAALAMSVALLGLLLAVRCERSKVPAEPRPHVETLMVGGEAQAE